MRTYRLAWTATAPGAGAWLVVLLALGAAMAAQGQPAAEAGVQMLTRGPVHEAFAEASMTGATAGMVITKTPYDPITELPPDQRPEGANVAWIPGYWSYDDDRSDFIWVSGVWRDLPPGRQWVPGYWTPVPGGSQWISGFWGQAAQTEVTYLPPPPEPLEAGPSSPAPAPDNVWTSGSWVWQQTRYDWQPGYWVPQQPDWVWCPAHYTWTPRGYVYVQGYWDHDIVHRGVMFAPVYYDQPVYRRPSYAYSPSIIIDLGVVAAFLFVQPRSHHYYFGDYYDHRYEERGFRPWYSRNAGRYGDDPVYMHYRSQQLRQDPDWDNHVQEQFSYRREHVEARPPQTFALQVNIFNTRKADTLENMFIGRTFAEASQRKTDPLRFAPVNADERKQFETRGHEIRKFQVERAKMEMAPKARGKSKEARAVSMQMPASPVAARADGNAEGVKAPPPTPETPKPQAVEGRGRQEKPKKVEMRTGHPQSQEKPGKTEGRPSTVRGKPNRGGSAPEVAAPMSTPQTIQAPPSSGREKPNRVESSPEAAVPMSTPQTIQAQPSSGREKPNRVESSPETAAPMSTPQTTQAQPPSGREKPNRAESRPETARPDSTPQNVAPQQEPAKRNAGRVNGRTNTRQIQNGPAKAEPAHESSKPQEPRGEVRTQGRESKAPASRTETRKQGGKRQQAPNTDNKDKKDEVR